MKHYLPTMITVGLLAGVAGSAVAETPAFMGNWATDASCPSHDIVTYGTESIESDYQSCTYQSITQNGENSWTVQAGCGYEGEINTVSFDLTVSGDTMREERVGAPALDYVRCGG